VKAGSLTPEDVARTEIAIKPRLKQGEKLLWLGRPSMSVWLHPADWFMVPFSLAFNAIAVAWSVIVLRSLVNLPTQLRILFAAAGLVFLIYGQYLLWGRLAYERSVRRRLIYAATDQQVLILMYDKQGLAAIVRETLLRDCPAISAHLRRDGIGAIRFGIFPLRATPFGRLTLRAYSTAVLGIPVFADIAGAQNLYQQLSGLREALLKREASAGHENSP